MLNLTTSTPRSAFSRKTQTGSDTHGALRDRARKRRKVAETNTSTNTNTNSNTNMKPRINTHTKTNTGIHINTSTMVVHQKDAIRLLFMLSSVSLLFRGALRLVCV